MRNLKSNFVFVITILITSFSSLKSEAQLGWQWGVTTRNYSVDLLPGGCDMMISAIDRSGNFYACGSAAYDSITFGTFTMAGINIKRRFIKDEGRPLGFGFQGLIPNQCMRL